MTSSDANFVDVLIIGAGLSGIGAAWHLQKKCPDLSYAILEARNAIGGTWDLFRYPGIRSDSDMHTLGYAFKPWTAQKAIADGPSILSYVRETAKENGIDQHVRFMEKTVSASWSSEEAKWTLTSVNDATGMTTEYSCRFLFMCTGYYRYEAGYTPEFPGADSFNGQIIHPQHWPENLDYSGKNIVVIGSGATAVTLVPELAKDAGHVTMLQRSPTYIVSRPAEDAMANKMRKWLPDSWAYGMTRWKNILLSRFFFGLARKKPEQTKARLVGLVEKELGPDYDVATHFTPSYNPWDQRLCLVPDGDLFGAVKDGSAEVVTDHIDHFSPDGIALKSGGELKADIIVTATGLDLLFLGDVEISVDGAVVEPNTLLNYKGTMFSGVPNLASIFGYTNASWTLKADITSDYVCRVLNLMEKKGASIAVPVNQNPDIETDDWLDFSSGYVQRSLNKFPKQATEKPWRLNQNYFSDLMALRYGKLEDGVLTFK